MARDPQTPRALPKGSGKIAPMGEDDVQQIFLRMVEDASNYIDEEVSPQRAEATRFYNGDPFGNEEEGRSQIVLTEVRDSVLAVLPSLLRIFTGPERVVEFVPRSEDDVALAASQTAAVQYVFMEENPGFMILHSALKDGLVRRLGIVKWGWDSTAKVSAQTAEGVTQEQIDLMGDEDKIVITAVENEPASPQQPQQPGQPAPAPPPKTFRVSYTYETANGQLKVWSVPPEEFIFNRTARSLEDAIFVGHRMDKTKGELLDLGIDEDIINASLQVEPTSLQTQSEAVARLLTIGATVQSEPPAGETNRPVRYVEGYARVDVDGDGIAELRRICGVGPQSTIVSNEPCKRIPFATFCPDPEPHTIAGQSLADEVMDLQRIGSSVLRSILDSAAASIFPRTWMVEGQANAVDLQNTAIGSLIRLRQPGMAGEFAHSFIGKEMMPLLDLLQGIKERRTGQAQGANGLDADALQSMAPTAANAVITGTQARQEMYARLCAEQLMKPMFRGMRECLKENQDGYKSVRQGDAWSSVNPQEWPDDMDVTVNVALGMADVPTKIQLLAGIAAKQEQALQTPAAVMTDLGRLRHTYAKGMELAGVKDVANYWAPLPIGFMPPPQQPQMTPEQTLAQAQMQIEHEKNQKDVVIQQSKLEQAGQKLQQDHLYRMAQLELDRYKAELQFRGNADDREVQMHTEQADTVVNALLQAESQHMDQANAEADRQHQAAMAAQQQAADAAQAQQPQPPQ